MAPSRTENGWIGKNKAAHYKSKSEDEAVDFRKLIASLPTMSSGVNEGKIVDAESRALLGFKTTFSRLRNI